MKKVMSKVNGTVISLPWLIAKDYGTSRASERDPAVSLGLKYVRHRRLAPVADLCVRHV